MMKWVTFMASIAIVIVLDACTDETIESLPPAPENCVEQYPSVGQFEVLVTVTTEFSRVPIEIFRGEIEDHDVVIRDTLSVRSRSFELFTGFTYAATARYVIGADTVVVIDASKVSVRSTDYSDKTCYGIDKGVTDLRLRTRP